jgi:carboxypeptidase C (cathepsin A)
VRKKSFFGFAALEVRLDLMLDVFTLYSGCSSLLGLMTENGPFTVQDDGRTLKLNPTAWNIHANMIWLESPTGVGFSWSSGGNYTTGDDQTAEDNYQFLLQFFTMFPQFKKNDFYIAGAYIPPNTSSFK